MNTQLYYAEVDTITSMMKADRNITVIGDSALFIVAKEQHKCNYYLDWQPVTEEAKKAYNL